METTKLYQLEVTDLIEDSAKLCDSRSCKLIFVDKASLLESIKQPRDDEYFEISEMEPDEHGCFVSMNHEIAHVGSLWICDIRLKINRGCELNCLERKMLQWYEDKHNGTN